MPSIKAYAAPGAGATLQLFEHDPGPLGDEQVEIAVEHCGICHSDLSMRDRHQRPGPHGPHLPAAR
jgi:uncharacterized zinc-type alcohol dehydrogenase-like protein